MAAVIRLLGWVLVLGLLAVSGVHAAVSVVIVSSDRSSAYIEAAQAIVTDLEQSGLSRNDILQVTAEDWLLTVERSPKLLVTLGSEAAQTVVGSDVRVPVLSALLPRSSFERILRTHGRKASSQLSALFLDQPLNRQLDLIRLALPSVRRVGVLWGTESLIHAPSLRTLALASGFQLVEASVEAGEPLFPALKRVLDDTEVLLAFADPAVFNSNTIQNVLLASFRARVPLVAFSPAYVRAGALLALYVTPAQVGQQVASVARGVLQGKLLPASPLYAQSFSVSVNEYVARSLGLSFDVDSLIGQLRKREGSP
jgi:putative ABC transport system substrate-binding protein